MTITTEEVRALAERIAAHTDFDEPASESENRLVLALAQDWERKTMALEAAQTWALARRTFLALPAGHVAAKAYLNDLSNAEDALSRAALQPISEKAET